MAGTNSGNGNIHNLSRGDIISVERDGIDADTRFIVIAAGDYTHRIYAEGDNPKQDWFKILDSEVLAVIEAAEKKGTAQGKARDRSGEEVKRVVHLPGKGYYAHLQRGQSENTRIAPIVGGKVSGAGEVVPTASLGAVYEMQFQTPRNRRAVLTDPAGAADPSTLGLTSAVVEKD